MNRVILILATLIGMAAMLILSYRLDSGKNRGHTTGYWGEFNTVSNALAMIGGITILSASYNADVTLEEFGFEVKTTEGRTLKLFYSETTPVRELSGDKLNATLAKEIQDALATQTSNLAQ
jgi:hypothetical protein